MCSEIGEAVLLLMRHGKSDWETTGDDFQRPLTKRGMRGAERIGQWLLEMELVPDLVLSSPAQRACDTAKRVCAAAGIDAERILLVTPLYNADWQQVLAVIHTLGAAHHTLLVVGHNPSLEHLLVELSETAPETPSDGKLLPTASLAQFTLNHPWSAIQPRQANLIQIKRANDLGF